MKPKHHYQIPIALLLLAYFSVGYLGINAFSASRNIFYTVGFSFEERIPFMAPFILGYLLDYGSVLLIYLVIPNWTIFKKVAWGFFWVMTVHYLFFLVFPVKMIWRPEIVEAKNFFEWLAQFNFSLDKPFNCFPSLHVAFPTLVSVLSWRFIPKWRFLFIAMALITAISVVMVKQHYIADALAGVLVATVIGVLIPRKSAKNEE